jgi:hypothetical protein
VRMASRICPLRQRVVGDLAIHTKYDVEVVAGDLESLEEDAFSLSLSEARIRQMSGVLR